MVSYRLDMIIPLHKTDIIVSPVDPIKLVHGNEPCLYLCGQSLGLKPKCINNYVDSVLNSWGAKGVHSHFSGYLPAALSDSPPKEPMARLVGANPSEIALMNGLTVNLHLLLCTFYKPTSKRHKIMIEQHSFSSDMVSLSLSLSLSCLPDLMSSHRPNRRMLIASCRNILLLMIPLSRVSISLFGFRVGRAKQLSSVLLT